MPTFPAEVRVMAVVLPGAKAICPVVLPPRVRVAFLND